MADSMLRILTQRLSRLERENRMWKIFGCGAVVVLGLLLLSGAAGSKVVEEVQAKQFTLVDKVGQPRARLIVNNADVTTLEMWEPRSGARISMVVNVHGALLSMFGKRAETRPESSIGLMAMGSSSSLGLNSKNGNAEITLGVPGVRRDIPAIPELEVVHPLVRLQLADARPSLELSDTNRTLRAVIGHTNLKSAHTDVVEQRPASSLVLFNESGNVIWKAP